MQGCGYFRSGGGGGGGGVLLGAGAWLLIRGVTICDIHDYSRESWLRVREVNICVRSYYVLREHVNVN